MCFYEANLIMIIKQTKRLLQINWKKLGTKEWHEEDELYPDFFCCFEKKNLETQKKIGDTSK